MNEMSAIGGCQNNEKNEFPSNVKSDYYGNSECWNSGTDEFQNNAKNDSVNYVSNVFQNNAKNESLNS